MTDAALPPAAVIDACVLYSASLRDLFMRLATRGLYRPKWTQQIHDEWIENLLEERPDLDRARLERTRDLMNHYAAGSLVEGYETLIPTLELPDPNDRHVLATAIHANAPRIVTFNLRDFPAKSLAPYDVEAMRPDAFLCDLFDDNSEEFAATAQELVAALRNPPRSWEEHLEILRGANLPHLAARLKNFSEK